MIAAALTLCVARGSQVLCVPPATAEEIKQGGEAAVKSNVELIRTVWLECACAHKPKRTRTCMHAAAVGQLGEPPARVVQGWGGQEAGMSTVVLGWDCQEAGMGTVVQGWGGQEV